MIDEQPFSEALRVLDAREQRLGGVPLAQADLSWGRRADEVLVRLQLAVRDRDRPDLSLLEVTGAHLLALWQATYEAQTTRVESGEAA